MSAVCFNAFFILTVTNLNSVFGLLVISRICSQRQNEKCHPFNTLDNFFFFLIAPETFLHLIHNFLIIPEIGHISD